jgi:hypothetical protein
MQQRSKTLGKQTDAIRSEFRIKENELKSFRNISRTMTSLRNLLQHIISETQGLFRQLQENKRIRGHDLQILNEFLEEAVSHKSDLAGYLSNNQTEMDNTLKTLLENTGSYLIDMGDLLEELVSCPSEDLNDTEFLSEKVIAFEALHTRIKEQHKKMNTYFASHLSF